MKRCLIFLLLASVSAQAADFKMAEVNEQYLKTVRPIFQKKCFDCHSGATIFPWYHQIPGVRQLLDHDTREARADMDMSQDFPFLGKGSPFDYLDAVEDVMHDGSMPPFRYRIIHRDSKLTDEDKKMVLQWIEASRKLLRPENE